MVRQVVIENPILNSPYAEPTRHFRFDDEGITNEIVENRRVSAYFVPVPRREEGRPAPSSTPSGPRSGSRRTSSSTTSASGSALWRRRRSPGRHQDHRAACCSTGPEPSANGASSSARSRPLETAIYLTEVAGALRRRLDRERPARGERRAANPGLYRIALKMATGSGKTVVMAMLIAWQALNKLANPQDARFTDAFLVVTPGITIRDRLRVLLPNDPDNYYRQLRPRAGRPAGRARPGAKIVDHELPRLHAAARRVAAGKLTKAILAGRRRGSPFTETPDQMVRRVCRELGQQAEHRRPQRRGPPLLPPQAASDDERRSSRATSARRPRSANEAARVWISGLEAVQRQARHQGHLRPLGHAVLPARLRATTRARSSPGSSRDFSLIDAIESGIVKVPRVPVADDSMTGDSPTYRDLWSRIRDEPAQEGPRDRRRRAASRKLPVELEGALHSLYGNYEKRYRALGADAEAAGTAAPRRRCSSSSATTPTSPSSSSTTSPAGRRRCRDGDDGRRSRRSCRSSATSQDGALAAPPQHHPDRLRAARVRRGA